MSFCNARLATLSSVGAVGAAFEAEKEELRVEIETLRDQIESSHFASTAADSALHSSVTAQKEHIAALKAALDKVSVERKPRGAKL